MALFLNSLFFVFISLAFLASLSTILITIDLKKNSSVWLAIYGPLLFIHIFISAYLFPCKNYFGNFIGNTRNLWINFGGN